MSWVLFPIYVFGALAVIATLLPMWRSTKWWVRVCDFPRFQIALLAFAILALLPFAAWPLNAAQWILFSAVAFAVVWQITWVWRYMPGAPLEVPNADASIDSTDCIALLTTNVLQTTRDADRLLRIVTDAAPDVILAVETDEWWCARLKEGLGASYRYTLTYPLSNGYGLALFSRLELVDPSIRFMVDDAIPSIKTGVRLRSGAVIDLYGVHPRPPSVQQDSTERDIELVRVGLEINNTGRPSVVLGDLNDVAWSPTTSVFKRTGGLLDPRRGRGFFNTYPAGIPGFRYPLDYIFHSRHFAISNMRVLPRFASDHLPLLATLYLCDDLTRK